MELDQYITAQYIKTGSGLPYVNVELWAGYDGQQHRMFRGQLTKGESLKQGAEWVTNLEIKDGVTAQSMQTAQPMPQNTSGTAIITQLLNDTGQELGGVSPDSEVIREPLPLYGNSQELARQLSGDNVFISDGKIYAVARSSALVGDVPVINAESGLLKQPQIKSENVTIELVCEPQLLPAQVLEVQADGFRWSGYQFQIGEIKHTFDNYGSSTSSVMLNIIPRI